MRVVVEGHSDEWAARRIVPSCGHEVTDLRAVGGRSRAVASPAEHRPRPGGIMPASLTAPLPPPPEIDEDEILRRGHLRVLRGQKGDA